MGHVPQGPHSVIVSMAVDRGVQRILSPRITLGGVGGVVADDCSLGKGEAAAEPLHCGNARLGRSLALPQLHFVVGYRNPRLHPGVGVVFVSLVMHNKIWHSPAGCDRRANTRADTPKDY